MYNVCINTYACITYIGIKQEEYHHNSGLDCKNCKTFTNDEKKGKLYSFYEQTAALNVRITDNIIFLSQILMLNSCNHNNKFNDEELDYERFQSEDSSNNL